MSAQLNENRPPDLGTFMAEVRPARPEGTPRLGRVTSWDGELCHLCPPGGGAEWTAAPDALRPPTQEERALIRTLTRPVRWVDR
ncbi:hypothetical protein ACIQRS_11130 [Streptomyces termitum]|uniref:Uncharacterized protein n=1 Tax=Streptomyces termitum TaxID=67368 RepID=A0A918SVC8_9ACTN|nr:hypothetical protein [Streptomyces termitum]GHA69411.1 hypothetical protein GCM10010305_09470 [Streptomyces termitum]